MRTRAIANTDINAPFTGESYFSKAYAFNMFRDGLGRDISGNARHLIRFGTNPAIIRLSAADGDENMWVKPASSSSGRGFQMAGALPASYTKWILTKLTTNQTSAFIQDTNVAAANQHRFQYSTTTNTISAGHGSNTADITLTTLSGVGADIPGGVMTMLALDYDSATQIMRLFVNGALAATSTSIANHAATTSGYLGSANGATTPANQLLGVTVGAGIMSGTLSEAEHAALNTDVRAAA